MCQPAGKLADRLHRLRMVQFLAQLLPLLLRLLLRAQVLEAVDGTYLCAVLVKERRYFEADISDGSFGQIQGGFQYGKQAGNASTYVAGTVLHQNGWRGLQSTDLQNVYGDVGWRCDRAELHLNITAAHSVLNGPGTSPVELLAADPSAQFTAPNQISNRYAAVSLNSIVDVTDTTSIQALTYYRYFLQRVTNGNAPNDTPCSDGSGLLCSESGPSTTLGGGFIPDFLNGGPYSELDN